MGIPCKNWFRALVLFCAMTGLPSSSMAESLLETTGDILQIGLPALAYGMTFAKHDSTGRNQFYPSLLTTLGVTYALKYSIDAERPNGGDASFPSGHAAAAFSGAAFIERRYGWTFGAPAYLAAVLVGWSRVETGNHYPQDVLGAAVIGVGATYFFTKPYLDKIAVMPFVDRQTMGIRIAFQW